MTRRVFFSFHYQRDIWRVNQIRNIGEIVGTASAGFHDASLWEETKKNSDAAIKALIDEGLKNTSVTIVCIGSATAGRKFIDYEINQSLARGNGLVGIQIHHLKDRLGRTDPAGTIPHLLTKYAIPIYRYVDCARLKVRIEEAARSAGK